MTHHALVYRLPEGITAEMVDEQVVAPIQASLTAAIEGDLEKAAEIAATMPAWVADLEWLGGPGMMSDGVTGEATMYLEPGNYIVECYVKTNGVQHNYNPVPGQFGIVFPLTVLPEDGGMAEPDSNVTLSISNAGFERTDGAFNAGENSVRVIFAEQRLYNNFVGHDVQVFRIDPDTDIASAARWVDFFPVDGQQTPAPRASLVASMICRKVPQATSSSTSSRHTTGSPPKSRTRRITASSCGSPWVSTERRIRP